MLYLNPLIRKNCATPISMIVHLVTTNVLYASHTVFLMGYNSVDDESFKSFHILGPALWLYLVRISVS